MAEETGTFPMTCVAPTVSAVLGIAPPTRATGRAVGRVVETLSGRKRAAILAPDALGLFAWELWSGEMPFLASLHRARSLVLCSVMPSITPVNFATMVTGCEGALHGIAAFDDDFACETLFDVVRRAGGTSAGVGIAGYTGSRLLGRFADIDGTVPVPSDDAVVERTLEIARFEAPAFLIVQLGTVDDVFHEHGPSSPEVVPMLRETDGRLERACEELAGAGYAVLVLSDHGQHDVPDAAAGEHRGTHGEDRDEDRLVPFTWR